MEQGSYLSIVSLITATINRLNDGSLTKGQFEEILDLVASLRDRVIEQYAKEIKQVNKFINQKRDV